MDPTKKDHRATGPSMQAGRPDRRPSGGMGPRGRRVPGRAAWAAPRPGAPQVEGRARASPDGEHTTEGAAWGADAGVQAARPRQAGLGRAAAILDVEPLPCSSRGAGGPGCTGPGVGCALRWRRAHQLLPEPARLREGDLPAHPQHRRAPLRSRNSAGRGRRRTGTPATASLTGRTSGAASSLGSAWDCPNQPGALTPGQRVVHKSHAGQA